LKTGGYHKKKIFDEDEFWAERLKVAQVSCQIQFDTICDGVEFCYKVLNESGVTGFACRWWKYFRTMGYFKLE